MTDWTWQDAEVDRILAMSDEEIIASATPLEWKWAAEWVPPFATKTGDESFLPLPRLRENKK